MSRKKINVIYWIFTGSFAALMFLGAIPDLISHPAAVEIIHQRLGYPTYFLPFLGAAKILGVAAILYPGLPRLKEWAYAGFAFDLIGAAYSHIAVGESVAGWIFILLPMTLFAGSYVFWHKKLKNLR